MSYKSLIIFEIDRGFLSVQFNIGGSLEELPACRLQEIRETVATILNCSLGNCLSL